MKTKEVIKELGKMNMITEIMEDVLVVYNSNGIIIATIRLNRKFEISTHFLAFENTLSEDEQEKVYVLLTKLAETDPSEREEEKRYYLKHKWFTWTSCIYLNLCISENSFMLHNNKNEEDYKVKFTQAEINEIKERFNTTLEDFEMVEVEE